MLVYIRTMHELLWVLRSQQKIDGRLEGKAKAIPLQAWTGTEGSRRLRLTNFKTIGTWRW
jgi:hypothetical protein